MITQLGGKDFASDESDDTTTVKVFGTGDRETRVAWAAQGETQRTFASDVPLAVTDMSGHTEVIKPKGGKVTVGLGASPVFIAPQAK